MQGFIRLFTGGEHRAGDIGKVSLFEVAGHAHTVVHGVCVRGSDDHTTGRVEHNNAINYAGIALSVVSLREGIGPQTGVHHGKHGIGNILVDFAADARVAARGGDSVAGQQCDGAVIAHDGNEGHVYARAGAKAFTASFVGVSADVLVNPDAVCLVADCLIHLVLNDVVVEEGSDIGGAHVSNGTEITGCAGAGYGIRRATVGNNVVGGEP